MSRINYGTRIALSSGPRKQSLLRGGAPVKTLRSILILIAFGLSSSALMADSIDPALGVKGDGDQSPWTGTLSVVMEPTSPGVTCSGGVCDFASVTFDSTVDIRDMDYLFNESQSTAFSVVDGSVFPILTVVSGVGTANPEAILSGGIICAITDDSCPNGVTDFFLVTNGVVQGTTVNYTSNVPLVSEPATLILMASGLGVICFRRRRQKQALA